MYDLVFSKQYLYIVPGMPSWSMHVVWQLAGFVGGLHELNSSICVDCCLVQWSRVFYVWSTGTWWQQLLQQYLNCVRTQTARYLVFLMAYPWNLGLLLCYIIIGYHSNHGVIFLLLSDASCNVVLVLPQSENVLKSV